MSEPRPRPRAFRLDDERLGTSEAPAARILAETAPIPSETKPIDEVEQRIETAQRAGPCRRAGRFRCVARPRRSAWSPTESAPSRRGCGRRAPRWCQGARRRGGTRGDVDAARSCEFISDKELQRAIQ